METKSFFNEEATQQAIANALSLIPNLPVTTKFETERNAITAKILTAMQNNSWEWDANCPTTIMNHAETFITELEKSQGDINSEWLCIWSFLFLYEYNIFDSAHAALALSMSSAPMYSQIESFFHENIENFDDSVKDIVKQKLRGGMIISIFRDLVNSEELKKIRELTDTKDNLQQLIDTAREKIQRVNEIEANIEKYENAYNFVGLYNGFDQLSKEKSEDKETAYCAVKDLGILAAIPLVIEFFCVILMDFKDIDTVKLTLLTVTCAGITAVALYYFRVALSNYKSIKAQLLQIEFRKTLCRFIESYTKENKDRKKVAFDKFENIIFSNIMADEGKMPATFDITEQFTALAQTILGKENSKTNK